MHILESVPTKDLVQALEKREGVEKVVAEPYQEINISVKGPAVILQITD